MHLIQILLPLRDNDGWPFPPGLHAAVRRELAERFGGLTAYSRAPAEGLWEGDAGASAGRDDIVVLEVMAEQLDAAWWRSYREDLERRFRQESVVVRALATRLL